MYALKRPADPMPPAAWWLAWSILVVGALLVSYLASCTPQVAVPPGAAVVQPGAVLVAPGAVSVAASGPVAPVSVGPGAVTAVVEPGAVQGPFTGPVTGVQTGFTGPLFALEPASQPAIHQAASAPTAVGPAQITAGGDVATTSTQKPIAININVSGSAWPLVAILLLLLALGVAAWAAWERYGRKQITAAGVRVGEIVAAAVDSGADVPAAAFLGRISDNLGERDISPARRAWDGALQKAGVYRSRFR